MEKKSFTNSYMRYSIRFFCSVKFKQSISKYFSFFVYTASFSRRILFQGTNGTFRMFIEGDDGIFDVTPSRGINEAPFLIRVKNSSKLDYETRSGIYSFDYSQIFKFERS